MNNLLKINATEFGVAESKAKQIEDVFLPMTQLLYNMEEEYNMVITEVEKFGVTKELEIKAKQLRKKISGIRIETEKTRKQEKEFYLRGGKAIDGIANILKNAIFEKENNLKEIEDYFENLEKEKIRKLQEERVLLLSEYIEDVEGLDLGNMNEDVWIAYFSKKKKDYDEKKEAEAEAERQRIQKEKEEKEEQERIKKENEKLKREAEERDKQRQKEIKEQQKKDNEIQEKLRKEAEEREKAEKKIKEIEDKKRKEEEDKKRKEEEEKAKKEETEKNKKYQNWLNENNYDEKTMKIIQEGNIFYLWELKGQITI